MSRVVAEFAFDLKSGVKVFVETHADIRETEELHALFAKKAEKVLQMCRVKRRLVFKLDLRFEWTCRCLFMSKPNSSPLISSNSF